MLSGREGSARGKLLEQILQNDDDCGKIGLQDLGFCLSLNDYFHRLWIIQDMSLGSWTRRHVGKVHVPLGLRVQGGQTRGHCGRRVRCH